MRTHDIGRLFWHGTRLTGAPLMHRGKTSMTDYPYRWARPVIIRLPRGRGLVVGWWREHKRLDITAHLAQALSLCPVDDPDLPTEDWFDGAAGQRAKKVLL